LNFKFWTAISAKRPEVGTQ